MHFNLVRNLEQRDKSNTKAMSETKLNVTFLNHGSNRENRNIPPNGFDTIADHVSSSCQVKWLLDPKVILLAVNPNSKRSIECGSLVANAFKDLNVVTAVTTSVGEKVPEATTVLSLNPYSSNTKVSVPFGHNKNPSILELNPGAVDLVIALGGDGTLLHVVWESFPLAVPPVIAFSLGSLGFLTLFDFPSYKQILKEVFNEARDVVLHMRLNCIVENKDGKSHYLVMNEVCFERDPESHVSQFEILCNSEHLTSIRGNGLIIATPSGSTAYSMSAGGPLIHPEMRAIILTLINSRSLSAPSLVFPHFSSFVVIVPTNLRGISSVTFDGKLKVKLAPGDQVSVSSSKWPVPVYSPGNITSIWTRQLKRCLSWNSRIVQGSND